MKIRTQFSIWFIHYFSAPFSWSRWTDIYVFNYAGPYLLQGKVNKCTNAKKFKVVQMKNKFSVAYGPSPSIELLSAIGLVDTEVKFNGA